ncbi:hypothetical protein GW17_00008226 [Ensete ventricosum]|nr:hypothetical protein GW17_00008226 [Ensete ventricosum]
MGFANSVLPEGSGKSPAPGRLTSVYSEVQTNRLHHPLPLPSVLRGPFKLLDGPPSSAAGNPGRPPDSISLAIAGDRFLDRRRATLPVPLIALLVHFVLYTSSGLLFLLLLSSWNVLDFLQERAQRSTVYGFKGGPAGIMKCKYVELTPDFIYPYRNQGGFDMICSGRDKIETPEQVLFVVFPNLLV